MGLWGVTVREGTEKVRKVASFKSVTDYWLGVKQSFHIIMVVGKCSVSVRVSNCKSNVVAFNQFALAFSLWPDESH